MEASNNIEIVQQLQKLKKYLEIPSEKRLSNWDELNEVFLKLLETRQQTDYPVVMNKEDFGVQFWISKKRG